MFGRFEADRCNELWIGDALHGPQVGGRKTYLFAFLDDRSRRAGRHRFGHREDTVRLAAALHPALAARGVPDIFYVDNGSSFVDSWLLRACASLGHQAGALPARPTRRAEEKSNACSAPCASSSWSRSPRTALAQVADLAELNRLFTAWVETVYHQRVHSETGQAPLQRWSQACPTRCRDHRRSCGRRSCGPSSAPSPRPPPCRCTATPTRSTQLLVGRKVELVFDPFDLTDIDVRYGGRSFGKAVAFTDRPPRPPQGPPEQPDTHRAPTGIDYLKLVDDRATPSRWNDASTTTPSPTSSPDSSARHRRPGRPSRRPSPATTTVRRPTGHRPRDGVSA